jgi:hypothetical protein
MEMEQMMECMLVEIKTIQVKMDSLTALMDVH